MKATPLVSVIIPAYNNADMVVDAVESVLAQTYQNRELIVVDDGSEDETADKLKPFEGRLTYIRQDHQGPAVARNAGIRAAKGQFVAFLDSDDIWMPLKLERSLPPFESDSSVGVVYTAVSVHEMDTGRRYLQPQYTMSGWISEALFRECRGVNTSTLVVRRDALERVKGFDEEFFRAQDWDLMLRLAEVYRYAHVPEVLTERRLHPKSLSVMHRDLYAKYNMMVIRKAALRRPDVYRPLEAEALARAHFRFGMMHYGDLDLKPARDEFHQSLKFNWNWRVCSYFLRTYLPESVIRVLRNARLSLQKKEKPHG